MLQIESACALDTQAPVSLVEKYRSMEDCTEELVLLIQTTPYSHLRKLKYVFLNIENYSIEDIIEITMSKVRVHRYTATYLLLSKIKELYRSLSRIELIERLYKLVFKKRVKDVDPLIRGFCLLFMGEWICGNKYLFKPDHVEYIVKGLEDRSDGVRRKAVRSFFKILQKYKGSFLEDGDKTHTKKQKIEKHLLTSEKIELDDSIKELLDKAIEKLFLLALYDANQNVKKDAQSLLCYLYSICRLVNEEMIFELFRMVPNIDTKYNENVLKKLVPGNIYNIERLVYICRRSGSDILKGLVQSNGIVKNTPIDDVLEKKEKKISTEDLFPETLDDFGYTEDGISHRVAAGTDKNKIEILVLNLIDYIKKVTSGLLVSKEDKYCSDNNRKDDIMVALEILSSIDLYIPVFYAVDILNLLKYNSNYVRCLVISFLEIKTYSMYKEDTIRLLGILEHLTSEKPKVLGTHYSSLLKKIHDIYPDEIDAIIERIIKEKELTTPIIQNFNISKSIGGSNTSLQKAYATIWKCIENEDMLFQREDQYVYQDLEDLPGIFQFLNFILEFSEEQGMELEFSVERENSDTEERRSVLQALGNMFYRLIISKYWRRIDEDGVKERNTYLKGATGSVSSIEMHETLRNYSIPDELLEDGICENLLKLIEKNNFMEFLPVLFMKGTPKYILDVFKKCKYPELLTLEYFSSLSRRSELCRIGKNLSMVLQRRKPDEKCVLYGIRKYMENRGLLESCLVYFVPLLSVEDCIILEAMVEKGKFKSSCMRKIKRFDIKNNEATII